MNTGTDTNPCSSCCCIASFQSPSLPNASPCLPVAFPLSLSHSLLTFSCFAVHPFSGCAVIISLCFWVLHSPLSPSATINTFKSKSHALSPSHCSPSPYHCLSLPSCCHCLLSIAVLSSLSPIDLLHSPNFHVILLWHHHHSLVAVSRFDAQPCSNCSGLT